MYSYLLQKYDYFFILIFIATIISNIPNTVFAQENVTCANSVFNCSNKQNLPYPFWGPGRPRYCGHPAFELTCSGAAPEITISSTAYRMLDFDTSNHILSVARADYWDTNCPRNLRNSTSDPSPFFSFAADTQNLTLFYNCSVSSSTPALPPTRFNCTADIGVTNFFGTDEMIKGSSNTILSSQIQGCIESVVVRISNSEATNLQSSLSNTAQLVNLTSVLESGFGINWSANDTRCEGCQKSGGLCGSTNSTTSVEFSCYCKEGTFSVLCGLNSTTSSGSASGIIGGVFVVIVLLSIVFICCCCCCCRRKHSKPTILPNAEFDVEAFLRNHGSFAPKRYSYANIKKMTNSFAEKIGKGGYGEVYKGQLPEGGLVAVKMLSECTGNGEEFMNEVASIGRTSHVNIVILLGFCYERKKRALVYEYMPNGSLDKLIFNQESSNANSHLESKKLYEIAVGIARGLEYLHGGCNTTILHFDIKPQNILLDKDLCPKISDFGLAKLWLKKENTVSMVGPRGTVGYIAPEVFSRLYGRVSQKSDVYSYGMLVLEMVGGRKNFDSCVSHTSEIYFPNRIYKDLEMGNELSILGNTTEEEKELLTKMIVVSFWCIQTNPSDRPSMSKVVEMLQGSLQSIEIPPRPYLFSPPRSPQQSPTPSS